MNSSDVTTENLPLGGFSTQSLARMIFRAELPEHYLRALPAQSLFLAIKHNGLESSVDTLESISDSQFRALLDFDLWGLDRFNEDNFWEWLAVTDARNDLVLLQKTLRTIDLKLVSMVLAKYVDVVTFEEPTDHPPEPKYYTPDRGYTWINIRLENEHRHFLLGRLLALIFETNPNLFYQVLAVKNLETNTVLEETSFQERNVRLAAEGIPDIEHAHQLNAPLALSRAISQIGETNQLEVIADIPTVEPLVYEGSLLQPLASFLEKVHRSDECAAELSIIMNSALVHFNVELHDHHQVLDLVRRVRGAINIGLQLLVETDQVTEQGIYSALGLRGLYRAGLYPLMELRRNALKAARQTELGQDLDAIQLAILSGLTDKFPHIPSFFQSDGSIQAHDQKVKAEFKEISQLQEIHALSNFLRELAIRYDKK
ncbi:MAG: hypothetical protein KDD42_06230 [Bdellovibrionales bacterium]|nr:hypothetical protein [Bdellovibrionales bacterium]